MSTDSRVTNVIMNVPPTGKMTATVSTPGPKMKVGDTIMTVGSDGKPVTLTVISVPNRGNRKARRKAMAEGRRSKDPLARKGFEPYP